jgi:proline iminopeptidase
VRVQVGDVRLYFDVEGTDHAHPAVLVPGGPGQSHRHHKVTPPIPQGRVVHYDHRGTGRSDASDRDHWNLATWTADLAGLCSALEIERPVILGTSFGAIVALAFAQTYPEIPSKLILVSGLARFMPEEILATFERLGGLQARRVAERANAEASVDSLLEYERVCAPLYTHTPLSDEQMHAFDGEPYNVELFVHWLRGEAKTLDLRPGLPSVRCPTLVLAGADDPIAPAAASREIASGISDAQLHVFDDCGHNPLHDARNEAMAVVDAFLN